MMGSAAALGIALQLGVAGATLGSDLRTGMKRVEGRVIDSDLQP